MSVRLLPNGGRTAFAALATLASLVATRVAGAQSHHPAEPWERRSSAFIAVGADGVFSSVRARASDPRIGDGYGFDAHASLGVSALAIGVGYQRTEHDLTGTTEHAVYSGYYVEPRVLLDLGAGNFTPYLVGRVGRTRVTMPPSLTSTTSRLTGTEYGAGGGLQVWLVPAVSLDLGAMWSRIDFGTHSSSVRDILKNGEDGVLLRAGVRLTP